MADKGFAGLDRDLPDHSVAIPHKANKGHPLEEAEKWANRDFSVQRIVEENTIGELKHFKVQADRFRSGWDRLDDAFFALVGQIIQRIACRLAPVSVA